MAKIDMEKFASALDAHKKSGKSIDDADADIEAGAIARMAKIRNDPSIKKLFNEADAETEAETEKS